MNPGETPVEKACFYIEHIITIDCQTHKCKVAPYELWNDLVMRAFHDAETAHYDMTDSIMNSCWCYGVRSKEEWAEVFSDAVLNDVVDRFDSIKQQSMKNMKGKTYYSGTKYLFEAPSAEETKFKRDGAFYVTSNKASALRFSEKGNKDNCGVVNSYIVEADLDLFDFNNKEDIEEFLDEYRSTMDHIKNAESPRHTEEDVIKAKDMYKKWRMGNLDPNDTWRFFEPEIIREVLVDIGFDGWIESQKMKDLRSNSMDSIGLFEPEKYLRYNGREINNDKRRAKAQ